MKIPFYKYQGTGNDFVIIDQFEHNWTSKLGEAEIALLCDRKFGVGGDGLIALNKHPDADFEMLYFNADGKPGSLCGNGSRCAVACMHHLGRVEENCTFIAYDGLHHAKLNLLGNVIDIQLGSLSEIVAGKGHYILDTGSPHYVTFVEDLSDLDIVDTGQKIRYSQPFREKGINVNFVEIHPSYIAVNTYERGVEAETLSCGTGVTASAIAFAQHKGARGVVEQRVQTKGGELLVKFLSDQGAYSDIWLSGPASLVFAGAIPVGKT